MTEPVNTQYARDFADAGDRYNGAEVRNWVIPMSYEIDRLRAERDTLAALLRESAEFWWEYMALNEEGQSEREVDADELLVRISDALGELR